MPIYKYIAKDAFDNTIKGTLKSKNNASLMSELAEKEIFLIQAKEINPETNNHKFTSKELADFTREIGTMLSVGVSLVNAMNIITNRDITLKIKNIYMEILQSLKNGVPFSESLKLQTGAFPDLFINMIFAGEESGQLDKTMLKMAAYYDKENRLNGRIKNAMTYPVILLIITVLVVIIIFVFILPTFFAVFKDMTLPLPTRIILGISSFMVNYWYLLIIFCVFIVTIITILLRKESVRISIDKFKLRIPKVRGLLKTIYTARFARTVSTLYASGLSIVDAIEAGQGSIGNRYIASQLRNVLTMVKNGVPLSKAITKVDGFDSKLSSVILIGEETGRLSYMLNTVADSFDYESENATQRLVTMLEPIMIIFMAVVIGFIMISVLMPILQIYQNTNAL